MKNTTLVWIAGFAVGLVLLVLLGPAIPTPKARAQRVQGVNNIPRPYPNQVLVISNLTVTNSVRR